jgi:hypothetical protein
MQWKFERLDSVELRDRVIKETVEALIHHYALICGSIGFPELILPT